MCVDLSAQPAREALSKHVRVCVCVCVHVCGRGGGQWVLAYPLHHSEYKQMDSTSLQAPPPTVCVVLSVVVVAICIHRGLMVHIRSSDCSVQTRPENT